MWLYVPPSTPSQSAPVSEASNSDCNSLTSIAEKLSEASVTSKGKHLPPPAWSRRWKRGGYIRLLSGLTLEPLTAQLGVDKWISSHLATPAKAILSPESSLENSTTDGSSIAPLKSLTPRGLQPSSARTSQGMRTDNLPLQSQHWKDWAAALRSEYSARPKLAIQCDENDCSSWPSAKASTGGWERDRNGNVYLTLQGAAAEWVAPVADDTGTRSKRYLQGGMALSMQATNWAAPSVCMTKGSSAKVERTDGKKRNDRLDYQTEQFFRPPSFPDHPITPDGETYSPDGHTSNQLPVKRKLNPFFAEALMRWPTGLSGFERSATELIQWQRRMLTFLSMLVCVPENKQMDMFGDAA